MSELSFLISKLVISLKMSSTLLVRAGKCLLLFVQFEASLSLITMLSLFCNPGLSRETQRDVKRET